MSLSELVRALEHARLRTEALVEPLTDEQLTRQFSPLQSPLVWDLAHIAHFEELWLLRRVGGRDAVSPEHDHLYDSLAHARGDRALLPILRTQAARAYMKDVRDAVLELLPELPLDDGEPLLEGGFAVGMVAQHELQHVETMTQTLALASLPGPAPQRPPEVEATGEVAIPGGSFTLGAADGWTYDNERPPHAVELAPFRIDRSLVTNSDFAAFVDAGGYRDPEVWSAEGWSWSRTEEAIAPLTWKRNGGRLLHRRFDAVEALPPREPVQHVSYHEAEAYARWAGKRLPTEPEWETAVRIAGDELEHGQGAVWQWTRSSFAGYPGFRAFRTATTRKGSLRVATRCYAAARGSLIRSSPGRRSATGISLSDGRSSPEFGVPAMASTSTERAARVDVLEDDRSALHDATGRGLRGEVKELPAVWLYDELGSRLYEEITKLPEYYLPRREGEILRAHAAAITMRTQARTLVELGAGNAKNTRHLLAALEQAGTLECFVPVDVSEQMLRASAQAVAESHPRISVHAVVGDFERDLDALPAAGPRLIALLGSTIGNLYPAQRELLLGTLAGTLSDDEAFLAGLDLVKDVARLEAAYNDVRGVTEAFVRNALDTVNRELGATFDQRRYAYQARWDPEHEWMDIGFRALGRHTVSIEALALDVAFEDGEPLRVEISSKFRREQFGREVAAAGLRLESWATDPGNDFALALLFRDAPDDRSHTQREETACP